MAEVLSPPLQSTMLPHSTSPDTFQGQSQQFTQSPRLGQQSRSMYNGQNTAGYRGTSAAPIPSYAFHATPTLRQDTRAVSAPSSSHGAIGSHRHAHSQSASASSTTSSDASSQPSAKDDSVMGSRNGSLINLSSSIPDLSLTTFEQTIKPSPDRYRHRPAQKRAESGTAASKQPASPLGASAPSSGSGMASASHPTQQPPIPQRRESVDDMAVTKNASSELAKRYRRRSLNSLDTSILQSVPDTRRPSSAAEPSATSTPTTIRPISFHSRSGSDESGSSKRKTELPAAAPAQASTHLRPDAKPSAAPPRTASDNSKRVKAPSPLSKEATDSETPTPVPSPSKPRTYAAAAQAAVNTQSPAAQQLAAVSDKDLNKGMKSRLRRAFSFGSAQELRRAAADNSSGNAAQNAQQTKEQHQQHIDDELDAESQEVARRQEAAGIGAGIYSGQGGFTGSMDNLSISSTASSASMMLRKMGRGAKKSARSIKGLFRPKSVIGVPAADGPIATSGVSIQPSIAAVSMVTVEAERLKVNVNEHPGDKHHGITGFPKLERNSIDAANGIAKPASRGSADGADSLSRRSIVGSDRDRADVLAAVKKGILKRSGTGSPSGSPTIRPNDTAGLQAPIAPSDSSASSMPSTPKDGHSHNNSMKNMQSNDYFSQRPNALVKSVTNTPNGSVRNITFSPRIQFHDAFSSTEYDRRGEIATCNRLTPMLAQQIKEELNTFKMEMEVHELSKPHTHFF